MQKNLLIGGGLGLLVVGLLAGYWYAASPAGPRETRVAAQAVQPPALAGAAQNSAGAFEVPGAQANPGVAQNPQMAGANDLSSPVAKPWPPASGAAGLQMPARTGSAAAPEGKRLTREERAQIRAKINEQMAALIAKGPKATLADAQAFMDEVEKTNRGVLDPRYFSTMRAILQDSAKTQALSQELTRIGNSSAQRDIDRRTAILAELRAASDRLTNGAASIQALARDTAAKAAR